MKRENSLRGRSYRPRIRGKRAVSSSASVWFNVFPSLIFFRFASGNRRTVSVSSIFSVANTHTARQANGSPKRLSSIAHPTFYRAYEDTTNILQVNSAWPQRIRETRAPLEPALKPRGSRCGLATRRSPWRPRPKNRGRLRLLVPATVLADHGAAARLFSSEIARHEQLRNRRHDALTPICCIRNCDRFSRQAGHVRSPLTERERECLLLDCSGQTIRGKSARILDLSKAPVNHYLNNVARKVGAVNRNPRRWPMPCAMAISSENAGRLRHCAGISQ